MTRLRTGRAHGIALVEMLIAIGLIAVFLIISARLFTTTIRLSRQSHDAEERIARFDSAVRMLRSDVWGAAEMTGDAKGVLTIARDATSIVWRADETGALVRSETVGTHPPREQRWPDLGGRLTFRVEGPVLVVAGDERSGRAGELRLVSQVRLAGVTR